MERKTQLRLHLRQFQECFLKDYHVYLGFIAGCMISQLVLYLSGISTRASFLLWMLIVFLVIVLANLSSFLLSGFFKRVHILVRISGLLLFASIFILCGIYIAR